MRSSKRYVLFEDGNGTKFLASAIAVMVIADQHHLRPDPDNNYTFTNAQLEEALQMDKADGDFMRLIGGNNRVVG